MPRLHKTSSPVDLTNAENSSAMDCSPAAANALPNSFDDWLTHPAEIITSEAEPEQGIFVELMNGPRINLLSSRPPNRPANEPQMSRWPNRDAGCSS
jgi:hypothetical protein